jgi:hypothetical protein
MLRNMRHPTEREPIMRRCATDITASDYPRAILETKAAIALAAPAMKGPLEEVLAQLQNGVDINR